MFFLRPRRQWNRSWQSGKLRAMIRQMPVAGPCCWCCPAGDHCPGWSSAPCSWIVVLALARLRCKLSLPRLRRSIPSNSCPCLFAMNFFLVNKTFWHHFSRACQRGLCFLCCRSLSRGLTALSKMCCVYCTVVCRLSLLGLLSSPLTFSPRSGPCLWRLDTSLVFPGPRFALN